MPDLVNDYGCDRTGGTDNAVQIDNAIADAALSGNSPFLKFPSGCTIAFSQISLRSNVTLIGDGPTSVLKCIGTPTAGVGRIDVPAGTTNWSLENFLIDGGVTTPVTIDYASVSSPIQASLSTGSSIWIHGGTGSSNGLIDRISITHTGGYAILLDATAGSMSGYHIRRCKLFDNRPHTFGVTPGGHGFGFGGWTSGIHYENQGITFIVDDVLVEMCSFLRMSGHAFWGHAVSLAVLNTNIRCVNNLFQDCALDACQMGAVTGFKVTGNHFLRIGYLSTADGAIGVPKWGTVEPVAVDHTGLCLNGDISNNNVDCFNGGCIDADGLGNTTVTGNIVTSPWSSNEASSSIQLASCGPVTSAPSTNLAVGFNLGNTNNIPLAATNVSIVGNQFNGCGAGAIRLYAGRNCKVQGNIIQHPATAIVQPIIFGPLVDHITLVTGPNLRCYGNDVSGNTAYWTPGSGQPMVVEDPQYSPFTSTEVNYVYNNTPIYAAGSPPGLVFPFAKAPTGSSTTGALRFSSVTSSTPAQAVCEHVLQTEHSLVGGTDAVAKIYKNVPLGSWVGSFAWQIGQSILDTSITPNHIQTVTARSGNSGGSLPTFNHAGGTTTDGGLTWTDRGVLQNQLVAQFSDTTSSFPSLTISGNGAIDNVRNLTGNSLTLYGAVTGGAPQNLIIDNAGNGFFRALAVATTAPWDLISNSSVNIIDSQGSPVGTTHGSGITWRNSALGYMVGIENTDNATNANGLLVKVANSNAATRLITLNVAGSDLFTVNAQGFVTGQAYSIGSTGVISASRDTFFDSVSIGSTPTIAASAAGLALANDRTAYLAQVYIGANGASPVLAINSSGAFVGAFSPSSITATGNISGGSFSVLGSGIIDAQRNITSNSETVQVANAPAMLRLWTTELVAGNRNWNLENRWTAQGTLELRMGTQSTSSVAAGDPNAPGTQVALWDTNGNFTQKFDLTVGGALGVVGTVNSTTGGFSVAGTGVIHNNRDFFGDSLSIGSTPAIASSAAGLAIANDRTAYLSQIYIGAQGSSPVLAINSSGAYVGPLNPSTLNVGTAFGGTAKSATFSTNAGVLSSTSGTDVTIASLGFTTSNEVHLGVHAVRSATGADWTTTALILGMDVDNSPLVGGEYITFYANGGIGRIGIGTKTPTQMLDVNGNIASSSGGFLVGATGVITNARDFYGDSLSIGSTPTIAASAAGLAIANDRTAYLLQVYIGAQGASPVLAINSSGAYVGPLNPATLVVGPDGSNQGIEVLSASGTASMLRLWSNDPASTSRNWNIVNAWSALGTIELRVSSAVGGNPNTAGVQACRWDSSSNMTVLGAITSAGNIESTTGGFAVAGTGVIHNNRDAFLDSVSIGSTPTIAASAAGLALANDRTAYLLQVYIGAQGSSPILAINSSGAYVGPLSPTTLSVGPDTSNQGITVIAAPSHASMLRLWTNDVGSGTRNWNLVNAWSANGTLEVRVSSALGGDPNSAGTQICKWDPNGSMTVAGVSGAAGVVLSAGWYQAVDGFHASGLSGSAFNAPSGGITCSTGTYTSTAYNAVQVTGGLAAGAGVGNVFLANPTAPLGLDLGSRVEIHPPPGLTYSYYTAMDSSLASVGLFGAQPGSIFFGSASNHQIELRTGNTGKLFISSGGLVTVTGIGGNPSISVTNGFIQSPEGFKATGGFGNAFNAPTGGITCSTGTFTSGASNAIQVNSGGVTASTITATSGASSAITVTGGVTASTLNATAAVNTPAYNLNGFNIVTGSRQLQNIISIACSGGIGAAGFNPNGFTGQTYDIHFPTAFTVNGGGSFTHIFMTGGVITSVSS